MTSDNKGNVTVLGLGDMGSALAEAVLKHNYATTVWNRSAEKTKPLTEPD
jgi:3-hydroxyisobutyrate dehydrogenase-like beta-hydroxyacid dehydrogenase